jgi:hypothetical protein
MKRRVPTQREGFRISLRLLETAALGLERWDQRTNLAKTVPVLRVDYVSYGWLGTLWLV